VVVYLEPLGGSVPAAPPERPVVRQRGARFDPGFLAIAAGQTIDMPNEDAIYHNVFSYSKPNDFDLGLYPSGQSRSVTFRHAGVVRTYCSIHESMNGTVFVAPTPLFAVPDEQGRFEIEGVPPGRYRLRTWCERLPATEREIEVGPGVLDLDVRLVQ
jgi:plastocyanin